MTTCLFVNPHCNLSASTLCLVSLCWPGQVRDIAVRFYPFSKFNDANLRGCPQLPIRDTIRVHLFTIKYNVKDKPSIGSTLLNACKKCTNLSTLLFFKQYLNAKNICNYEALAAEIGREAMEKNGRVIDNFAWLLWWIEFYRYGF